MDDKQLRTNLYNLSEYRILYFDEWDEFIKMSDQCEMRNLKTDYYIHTYMDTHERYTIEKRK
jgi:hypothetical protein